MRIGTFPPMRLTSFSIVTLMISAIFIWIYVVNSFWTLARDIVAMYI